MKLIDIISGMQDGTYAPGDNFECGGDIAIIDEYGYLVWEDDLKCIPVHVESMHNEWSVVWWFIREDIMKSNY